MKRLLTVAVALASLFPGLAMCAQSRGGAHAASAAPARGGGFSSFRTAPSPTRATATRPAPSAGSSYWRRGPVSGLGGRRPFFGNRGYYYGWPWWYGTSPNYFSYPLYPYYGYPFSDNNSASYQQAPAQEPEQDSGLSDEVAQLNDQVQMLQQEQEYLRPPAAEMRPAAATQEKPLSTVLVYRDGHQLEVQNYAVMGDTVWVLGDQTTRKIPLNELDLDVTQKLNADRGIEFVATPRKQ
jgi:hypothetical protein